MRLIVAISGASGAIYGIKILEELKKKNIETHLVISKWGKVIIREETQYSVEEVQALASYYYYEENMAAPISSGSFKCEGMIISPCSMKTLSGIATGYSDELLIRAADVSIKENRKLCLLTRETPLSSIHLENMLTLSRIGVVIMPPVPAFYTRPNNIEDIVNQTVGRVLDQYNIEMSGLKRWEGNR